ncbi:MAG TPA: TRAP transporter substrate-binding protein [Candidatus Tectomicrobia bacterium]|nr:TRAP transporter substrate-binding protein [Candidatus Tectomicrobia bacterium]
MKTQMSHRFSIAIICLAGALALCLGYRPTDAGTRPTTLKVQASWPPGIIAYDNLRMFAERVEKMSGGRLKIEHLPAGAIVGPFEVLDATSRGVIDGAHTAPGYWVGKHWAAIPLSHGPLFGMDYIDFFGWYYEGGGYELMQEWYQEVLKLRVVSFPIQPGGPQALGWFKKQITGWDDFKGVKFRIYGLGADVFKEAGMSVVTLPGAEILPAAERGVIDGAEWVGGIQDLQLGFHNVWKIHYTPAMHEQVTVGDLILNKDVYDKLSADLQEIIKVASKEVWFSWWAKFQKANAEAYKEMVEKHGVQVYKTPDDILQKFMEVYDKLIERQMAADPFVKKVMESQRQWASLVVPYRRSTWPPYQFLSDHYWKDKIFLK